MLFNLFTSTAVQKATEVDDSIALALSEGTSHIYIEGSSEQDNANNWTQGKIDEVNRKLQDHRLSAIVHGNYRNPICHQIKDIREAAIGFIKKEIDLACALNAPLIVHASSLFTHSNLSQLRRAAMADFAVSVNELCQYAKRFGVTLWLENLEHYRNKRPFYTLFSTFEQYSHVFSEVDPSVKFILDLGHENISAEHPHETLDYFIDRIAAISVSNNDGQTDSHSPLSKGTLEFNRIIKTLQKHQWTGHLTIETKKGGLKEAIDHLTPIHHQTNTSQSLAG